MKDNKEIAYTQLYKMLQCISVKQFEKIPEDLWKYIKQNKSSNYEFKFDPTKNLEEQGILKETKEMYDLIYEKYLKK